MNCLVQHFLEQSTQRLPDKIALICGEQRLSYRQVNQWSDQLANSLLQAGVQRQDRVAILLDNSIESVIALFGILKAGAIFIMLSASMKPRKLEYILKDAGARVLITHRLKAPVVLAGTKTATALSHIVWVDDVPDQLLQVPASINHLSWNAFCGNDSAMFLQSRCRCIDRDLATIIYTSGSTGDPKGVMSAHCNVVAAAHSITRYLENVEDDIIMDVLPLSFDYGLYQVLMAFFCGATVVLEKSFLFPIKILEKIEKEKVTGFPLVPTMAALLLQMDDLGRFDFSALRYITNTAAALPAAYIRKLRGLFPHVRIFSMYGLTECKRVSYLPPEEIDRRPDSVGIPIPNEEVFVLDETGREVPPGQVGELVIRGSNVMQGYWNAPEETAKRFKPGRYGRETWLYSGDLFKRDSEGFLYFVARKDDMIKTKGERVSPKEIENALLEMDGVVEVAVIGVPDDIFGQAIKAYIVVGKNAALDQRAVLKYCSQTLEPFMIPKYVEFKPSFPKNPSGKIDKKQLALEATRGEGQG